MRSETDYSFCVATTQKRRVCRNPYIIYGVYVDLCGCFSFTFLFHTDLKDLKDVGFADYTYGNAVPPRRRLQRSYLSNLLNPCGEKPAHPTKSVAGLNQTPTIPDRKRTECPLPHAVGF